MKIVVIGGTGLIGSKTVPILRQGGHEVVAARRIAPVAAADRIGGFDPISGLLSLKKRTVVEFKMQFQSSHSGKPNPRDDL